MRIAIIFLIFFASFAFAQRQSVVVLPSLATQEANLTPKQKELLTEEVRTIAAKLPSANFFLVKQDEVNEVLGDEAVFNACEEGTCVGQLVKQLQATFGARCDVYTVEKQMYLKFELYGTLKGLSEAQTIDQFNEPVKDFAEMQTVIKAKVPIIFDIITKPPQEVCEAEGNAWVNGVCKTQASIAKETCEAGGKTWIGGACKSSAQIACEATPGQKWTGEDCKSDEHIACESEGKIWESGVCKSPFVAPAAPAYAQGTQVEAEPDWASLTTYDRVYLGFKVGLVYPSMSYSDEGLDAYSSSVYANSFFELFGEYMLTPSLSLRPGFKFLTRGQHIDEAGFTYEFDAKYTEITVPVAYTFGAIKKKVYPYVLGGPVFGIARGGDIYYRRDYEIGQPYKTDVSESSLSSFSFGLYLGAGAKYPLAINKFNIGKYTVNKFFIIPGLEIGYHLGLTNTYGDKELSEDATALNALYYNISGSRRNRGFEWGVTLAVPLGNFKRIKKQDPPPATPPPPPPPPEPEPEPTPEPEKLCYTIDEMKELIRNKQDIQGKKICAVKQVSFQTGSHILTSQDKVYLDEMVILMQTNELIKVRVNGHTDNVGNEEFNTNLSRERAKAVHDYLKSKGIDASRLSFAYFGPTRPIADNNTEEGRAINRRVEFEIINQ